VKRRHDAECELEARIRRAREMGFRSVPLRKEVVAVRARARVG
jgi:hypothetical protein